jgi:dihydrofolate reductase
MAVKAIVAMDEGRVIGCNGALPWRLPEDLKRFSKLTKGGAVVMGRKTYDSLPERSRPLRDRRNIVLTKNKDWICCNSVKVLHDIGELQEEIRANSDETFWIIGGSELYKQTIEMWDELFLTFVFGEHSGDSLMPPFENSFSLVDVEQGNGCEFRRYLRLHNS